MRRALVALWLIVGVAVWNGVFDLYISRGAREYGQKAAEAELGRGAPVTMDAVMLGATHDGVEAASIWASVIIGCGWFTVWVTTRPGRTPVSGA